MIIIIKTRLGEPLDNKNHRELIFIHKFLILICSLFEFQITIKNY